MLHLSYLRHPERCFIFRMQIYPVHPLLNTIPFHQRCGRHTIFVCKTECVLQALRNSTEGRCSTPDTNALF